MVTYTTYRRSKNGWTVTSTGVRPWSESLTINRIITEFLSGKPVSHEALTEAYSSRKVRV